jgi:hypothetical protein
MVTRLSDARVADLLVVLGAIARIVDEGETPALDRLTSIRQALANVGITSTQTRAERIASIRRTAKRQGAAP